MAGATWATALVGPSAPAEARDVTRCSAEIERRPGDPGALGDLRFLGFRASYKSTMP